MKFSKKAKVFLFLVFGLSFLGKAQNDTTAVFSYHNLVLDHQNLITKEIGAFFNQIEEGAFDASFGHLKSINKFAKRAVKDLSSRGNPEGTEGLKQSALLLFIFYRDIAEEELQSFLAIAKDAGNLSDEQNLDLITLYERVYAIEQIFDEKFRKAQESLAQKYNFVLLH